MVNTSQDSVHQICQNTNRSVLMALIEGRRRPSRLSRDNTSESTAGRPGPGGGDPHPKLVVLRHPLTVIRMRSSVISQIKHDRGRGRGAGGILLNAEIQKSAAGLFFNPVEIRGMFSTSPLESALCGARIRNAT